MSQLVQHEIKCPTCKGGKTKGMDSVMWDGLIAIALGLIFQFIIGLKGIEIWILWAVLYFPVIRPIRNIFRCEVCNGTGKVNVLTDINQLK